MERFIILCVKFRLRVTVVIVHNRNATGQEDGVCSESVYAHFGIRKCYFLRILSFCWNVR